MQKTPFTHVVVKLPSSARLCMFMPTDLISWTNAGEPPELCAGERVGVWMKNTRTQRLLKESCINGTTSVHGQRCAGPSLHLICVDV